MLSLSWDWRWKKARRLHVESNPGPSAPRLFGQRATLVCQTVVSNQVKTLFQVWTPTSSAKIATESWRWKNFLSSNAGCKMRSSNWNFRGQIWPYPTKATTVGWLGSTLFNLLLKYCASIAIAVEWKALWIKESKFESSLTKKLMQRNRSSIIWKHQE